MDRRHWWLVSKLQESFGDSLRSAQLETFLCQEGTLPTLLAFTSGVADNPGTSPRAIYVWRASSDDVARGSRASLQHARGVLPPAMAGGTLSRRPRNTATGSVPAPSSAAVSATGSEDASTAAPSRNAVRETNVRFVMDTTPPSSFSDKCVYFLRLPSHDGDDTVTAHVHPGAGAGDVGSEGTQQESSAEASDRTRVPNGHVSHRLRGSDGGEAEGNSKAGASVATPQELEADPEAFAARVLWGEVEANLTCDMHAVFSTVLLPRVALQNWGAASTEEVQGLKQAVDRFFGALPDSNVLARAAHLRTITLRVPEDTSFVNFVPGARPTDPGAQAEAEALVEDWMEMMEGILHEAAQERPGHLRGVGGEEEFWLERQGVLSSITDQLKTPVCQGVVGVLIATQSRLIKRWRVMDAHLTDAANECKDILRYLENIRPQLRDVEQQVEPQRLLTAIPALLSAAKLSSSMLRHANVQAFVESLFSRLSQEMAHHLVDFLSERPEQALEAGSAGLALATLDGQHAAVPSPLQWPCWLCPEDGSSSSGRLAVLPPAGVEAGSSGAAAATRGKPAAYLRPGSGDAVKAGAVAGTVPATAAAVDSVTEKGRVRSAKDTSPRAARSRSNAQSASRAGQNAMPSLALKSDLGASCQRLSQVVEVCRLYTDTLASVVSKRRPARASVFEGSDTSGGVRGGTGSHAPRTHRGSGTFNTSGRAPAGAGSGGSSGGGAARMRKAATLARSRMNLAPASAERSGTLTSASPAALTTGNDTAPAGASSSSDPTAADNTTSSAATSAAMSNSASAPNDDIFAAVQLLQRRVEEVLAVLRPSDRFLRLRRDLHGSTMLCDTGMLAADVARLVAALVASAQCLSHTTHAGIQARLSAARSTIATMEEYVPRMLNDGVSRSRTTEQGIVFFRRFKTVEDAPYMAPAISSSTSALFDMYRTELEQILVHYEAQKDAPPVVRGAPPTVGHMMWARQMLGRIEPPMLFFRQRGQLTGAEEAQAAAATFALHNKLSAALLKFEAMWLAQWRTRLQGAASGFRATLLVQHPVQRRLLINVDANVLSLLEEARAMQREGIAVPASTAALLPQGIKYKSFADALKVVLERYENIVERIPTLLKPLLAPRFASVMQAFRPGLVSLTWEASNIDVYLGRVEQTLDVLEADATELSQVLASGVDASIEALRQLKLCDLRLEGRTSLAAFNAHQTEVLAAATRAVKTMSIRGMGAIVEILEKAFSLQGATPGATSTAAAGLSAAAGAVATELEPRFRVAIVRHYEQAMKEALKTALTAALTHLAEFLSSSAFVTAEGESTEEAARGTLEEGPIAPPFTAPPSVSLMSGATRQQTDECTPPVGYLVLNIELASPKILQSPSQATVSHVFGEIVSNMTRTCTVGHQLCTRAAEATLQRFGHDGTANTAAAVDGVWTERDRTVRFVDNGSRDEQQGSATALHAGRTETTAAGTNTILSDSSATQGAVAGAARNAEMRSDGSSSDLAKDGDVLRCIATIDTHLLHTTEIGAAKLTELDETTWKWEQSSSSRATNILKRRASKGVMERRSSRKEVQEMELDLQQLVDIERSISRIPDFVSTGGPFRLRTRPMRLALAAEANAWKAECAAGLYSEASQELARVGQVARELRTKMSQSIETLEDLQRMVDVLHTTDVHSQDLDTSALEDMYSVLQEIGLSLPREETAALETLQRECTELRELTLRVRVDLTKTRRPEFERLLDTQAKSLMVASIHLRNSFNTSGPTIKGIAPSEALLRLRRLQELHAHLAKERETLAAAEALLTLPLTPYPELERTGRDLARLSLLYDLYERFLELQQRFLNAYWNDVDLKGARQQLQAMVDSLRELPEELHRWDAFSQMNKALTAQLEVLPLLLLLASPSIRDRHWREVMHMTRVTFPLEGLTINKVMSLNLPSCANKVQELARTAMSEAELESGLSEIQNTWNEHVFPFQQPANSRHIAFLEEASAQHLISNAQESHMRLHAMLNSPSLGPHRTDIVAWMAKLKEMATFLTRWLDVQQLWSELELMVSVANLETQAKQLHMVLRDLLKFGSLAQETANIVQFCFGADSDNTKISVLDGFRDRLEACRKSLAGFLEEKRKSFARFYYLSDTMLLRALGTVLEEGPDVPLPLALRQLLPSIQKVTVETTPNAFERKASRRSLSTLAQAAMQSAMNSERRGSQSSRRSSGIFGEATPKSAALFITSIISKEGERLRLSEPVALVEDVASWAAQLLSVTAATLHGRTRALSVHLPKDEGADTERSDAADAHSGETLLSPRLPSRGAQKMPMTPPGMPFERNGANAASPGSSKRLRVSQQKYNTVPSSGETFSPAALLDNEVAQIGLLATRLHWTAVVASGIEQVRVNRFALRTAHQDVSAWATKVMNSAAARKRARSSGLVQHKMQALVTLLVHLRDLSEELLTSRCRDLADFNWQKQLRWYMSASTGKATLTSLYASLAYGDDFLGVPDTLFLSSLMDKYHMLLLQTLASGGGRNGTPIPSIVGPANCGKSDVIESLSSMLGRQLVKTSCTSASQPAALMRMVTGLNLSGSWGIFMEISDLTLQALSVLVEHVRFLQYRVRTQARPTLRTFGLATIVANRTPWGKKLGSLPTAGVTLSEETEPDSLDHGTEHSLTLGSAFAVFATVTVGHSTPLPEEIKACFREIHILQPSPTVIAYAQCLSSGLFFNSKSVAEKLIKLITACSETFCDLSWMNFGLSTIRHVVQECALYRTAVKDAAHMSGRGSRLGSGSGVRTRSAAGVRFPRNSYILKDGQAVPQGILLEEQDALILALAFYHLHRTAMDSADLLVLEEIIGSVVPLFGKTRFGMLTAEEDVRAAIETVAARSGLVPERAWVDKGIDIFRSARTHRAIVVLGPSGAGKTSCTSTLIGALSLLSEDSNSSATARSARNSVFTYGRPSISESETGRLSEVPPVEELEGENRQHRLHRIYPGAVREEFLYGYHRSDGEWVEGIVPSIVRQALHGAGSNTMHWVVLDGPFAKTWTHHLRQALSLSSSSYICLGNGDQLFIPSNLRFIFESTREQSQAAAPLSPHIASVHMGEDCVPWQSLVVPWLRSRRTPEADLLEPLFHRYLESCLELLAAESMQSCLEVPRCGRIRTLLMILTSLLEDSVGTATILPAVHMECNFLFAMAWALGGALDRAGRKLFHDHLCTMTSLMPNENASCTIFDYRITASADWETWTDVAAELEQELTSLAHDRQHPRGRFVPTSETACAAFLLQLVNNAGGSALLVSEHGAGRSTLVAQVTQQQRHVKALHKLAVSGSTSARLLQRFVTRHTTRRTGHVYGADGGKPLLLVLDDVDACCEDLFLNEQALKRTLQSEMAGATGPSYTAVGLSPSRAEYNSSGASLAGRGNMAHVDDHTHAHEVLRLLLEEGQWFPADGDAERRSHTLRDFQHAHEGSGRNRGRSASVAGGSNGAGSGSGGAGHGSRGGGSGDDEAMGNSAVVDDLQDARWITDLQVVATAQPSVGRTTSLQRVTRHLAVFFMPPASAESAQAVLSAQLIDGLQPPMREGGGGSLSATLAAGGLEGMGGDGDNAAAEGYFRRIMAVEALVEMTRTLVRRMAEAVRPDAANRYQCVFGAKETSSIVRGLRRINLARADLLAMAAFWRQECLRVLGDRMAPSHDATVVEAAVLDLLQTRSELFGPWPAQTEPCPSPSQLPWFAYTPPCGLLINLQQAQRALAAVGITVMDVYMRLASKAPAESAAAATARGMPPIVTSTALVDELWEALRFSLPQLSRDGLLQEVDALADTRGRLTFRAACQVLLRATEATLRKPPVDSAAGQDQSGDSAPRHGKSVKDEYPQLLDFIDCLNPVEYFHAPPSQARSGNLKGRPGTCQPCPRPLLTAMLRLYVGRPASGPGGASGVSSMLGSDGRRAHAGPPQIGAAVDSTSRDDPVTPDFAEIVLRLCRVLNLGASHGIFVAPPGAGVRRACLVAAEIAGCAVQEVSGRSVRSFNRDMRAVYRTGGSKNKAVCAVIDGEQLPMAVVERLHSFIVQGEIFDLFAAEEEQALYEGVEEDLAQDGTPGLSAQAYFQGRLERNVHIVLHFNSWVGQLHAVAQHCPTLLSQCYLYHRPGLNVQSVEQYAVAYLCNEESFSEFTLGALLKIARAVTHLFTSARTVDTRSLTDLQSDLGKAEALADALQASEVAAGSGVSLAVDGGLLGGMEASLLLGGVGGGVGSSGPSGNATGMHASSAHGTGSGGSASGMNSGAGGMEGLGANIGGAGGVNGVTMAASAAAAGFLRAPADVAAGLQAEGEDAAQPNGAVALAAARDTSFCQLRTVLSTFVAVYGEKRAQQREQQQQLECVLHTCKETDAHIAALGASAQANASRIKELNKALATALDNLTSAAAEQIVGMVDEGLESDDDEELLAAFVNEKRHARRTRVVERGQRPSLASPRSHMHAVRLEASLREVEVWQSKLTLKRIDTLRSLTSPPLLVQLVCDMMMLVLGRSMDGDVLQRRAQPKLCSNWPSTSVQLQDPLVADRLQRFDVMSLDDERVELLDVYLSMPQLTPQRVHHASKDAYVVLEWICHMLAHLHLVNQSKDRSRYSSVFAEELLVARPRASTHKLTEADIAEEEAAAGNGMHEPSSVLQADGADTSSSNARPTTGGDGRMPFVLVEEEEEDEEDGGEGQANEEADGDFMLVSQADGRPAGEGGEHAASAAASKIDTKDTSMGMKVVAASLAVQRLQREYDELLGTKQACEATALELERRLRAAHKRQSSFESHVAQWTKHLQQLQLGRWACVRNSLMVATFASFSCNCTDAQRKALKWQLLATSATALSPDPVRFSIRGARVRHAFDTLPKDARLEGDSSSGGTKIDGSKLQPDGGGQGSRPGSGRSQSNRSPSTSRRRSPSVSRPISRVKDLVAITDLSTVNSADTLTGDESSTPLAPSATRGLTFAAADEDLLWDPVEEVRAEVPIVFRDCTLGEFLDHRGRTEAATVLTEQLSLTAEVQALARLALQSVSGTCCPLFYDPAELLVPWLTAEMASSTVSAGAVPRAGSTGSRQDRFGAEADASGMRNSVAAGMGADGSNGVASRAVPLARLSSLPVGQVRVCSYEARNFRAELKGCLTSGLVLVATNITSQVWSDVRLADVLNRKQCLTSQGHVAVSVAGEVVDWHPNFRLLLLSRTPLQVPGEFVARVWPFSLAPGVQSYHLCAFARIVHQRQPGLYASLSHTLELLVDEQGDAHDLSQALLQLLSQVQRNTSARGGSGGGSGSDASGYHQPGLGFADGSGRGGGGGTTTTTTLRYASGANGEHAGLGQQREAASGQDLHWADSIVDTQHRYDLAVGRVMQTRREVCELLESMDASLKAAAAIANMLHTLSFLPAFAPYSMTIPTTLQALEEALEGIHMDPGFTATLLCRQFAGLVHTQLQAQLAEPHRRALELLLALHCQTPLEEGGTVTGLGGVLPPVPHGGGSTARTADMRGRRRRAPGPGGLVPLPPVGQSATAASRRLRHSATPSARPSAVPSVSPSHGGSTPGNGTGTAGAGSSNGNANTGLVSDVTTDSGSSHVRRIVQEEHEEEAATTAAAGAAASAAESPATNLLLTPDSVHEEQPLVASPLYVWMRRAMPHIVSDWAALDLGQTTDSKGLVMPLADLKLKNAQLESKISALQARVVQLPWLAPLTHMVEPLARHRAEWMAWRDAMSPEVLPMPSGASMRQTPDLALMLGASLRPDRFLPLAEQYVNAKLGRALTERLPTLWQLLVDVDAAPATQPLLLLRNDGMSTVRGAVLLKQWATERNQDVLQLSLGAGVNANEVHDTLSMCMARGLWFMLTSVQSHVGLAMECVQVVQAATRDQYHDAFRLVLLHGGAAEKPEALLSACSCAYIGDEGTFRGQLAQALASVPPEVVQCCSRTDWVPLLHNLCYLHTVLNKRRQFGLAGWSGLYHWSQEHLQQVVAFARQQFERGESSQRITSVRYYVELVYSSQMTSARDRRLLGALIAAWICSAACKTDFEFFRRLPATPGDASPRSYKAPSSSAARRGRGSVLLDMAAQISVAPELDEAALPWACQLPGHAMPGRASGSVWLREALRQLMPVLDTSGASCLPWKTVPVSPETIAASRKASARRSVSHTLDNTTATRGSAGGPPSAAAAAAAATGTRPNSSATAAAAAGAGTQQSSGPATTTTAGAGGVRRAGLARRTSRGRLTQRTERSRPLAACPSHRPPEVHRLLHALPAITGLVKQRRRLETNGASPILQRFLLMQADVVRAAHRHVLADLRHVDQICAGRRSLNPEATTLLQQLEQDRTPPSWRQLLVGCHRGLASLPLGAWLDAMVQQARDVERAASLGLRTASFGLGLFPVPRPLLTALRVRATAEYGEEAVFHADITAREREHLREPPSEGVFLHGLVLHGAVWEAPPGEAREQSRYAESALPVIHVHFSAARSEDDTKSVAKPRTRNETDAKKRGLYRCPVYLNLYDRPGDDLQVLSLALPCETADVAHHLAIHGVHCSLRQ